MLGESPESIDEIADTRTNCPPVEIERYYGRDDRKVKGHDGVANELNDQALTWDHHAEGAAIVSNLDELALDDQELRGVRLVVGDGSPGGRIGERDIDVRLTLEEHLIAGDPLLKHVLANYMGVNSEIAKKPRRTTE